MKSYLITYSWPIKYRGSYLVNAVDGFEASSKVTAYLNETYGPTNDAMSVVTEIVDGKLQIIG